ncbi:MAG TPA: hypothetical protein VL614_16220 [Acetobacteraceae bacterium]|jgi:hypothetical protein|nr:hypothetical protein [Acetobacteraceae bacterium]
MWRLLLPFAALLLAAQVGAALGDEPLLRPTHDVDVIYRATAGTQVLQQRVRWSVAAQSMRIDPPTTGVYVIIDYLTRRMSVVHDQEKSVVEMAAPAGVAGVPGSGAAGAFVRRGEAVVDGFGCVAWNTTDRTGKPADVCITSDGVLLQASAQGRTLVSAVKVQYAQQDPALFRVPTDYTHRVLGATR